MNSLKYCALSFFLSLCLVGCNSTKEPAEASLPQAPSPAFVKDPASPVNIIAFGSCNQATLPQPLWEPILSNKPDLWIWTGDIVYADNFPEHVLVERYQMQKNQKDYAQLRKTTQILGTWDDHDYGLNNGGKEYEGKVLSQKRLLDFLDIPEDHPRRNRNGVYDSITYGPEGQRVKIILLDCRYHRDSPGPTGDILGENQWTWLESELRNSDAQIHVIASGIQVVSPDHPFENWTQFPKALERLYKLIGETAAPGVVFISGDRHLGEISMNPDSPAGYPIYDVTSSGLTHSYDTYTHEDNRYRVSEVFPKLNFGLFLIDWENDSMELQVRDQKNTAVLSQVVKISSLK